MGITPPIAKRVHRLALFEQLPQQYVRLLREIGQLGNERGYQVYVVGGLVRDLLLGYSTLDIDLVVEGDGIAFAQMVSDRYSTGLVVFERFRTARLVFPSGLKMDIATARRESYSQPADLPIVQPASIEEDLYRRDFTINAIAAHLNPERFGSLVDPHNGQRDLRTRIIRVLHTGSFQDDPTRIFRAIRFEQRLSFSIERATLGLLRQAASTNLIQQLSGPRLQNEILLLLTERTAVHMIARLAQLKLFRFLHPRLCYTVHVKQVIAAVPKALLWWATQVAEPVIDRSIVYLVALACESNSIAVAGMIKRLAFSREQVKNVRVRGSQINRVLKKLTTEEALRPSQVYHFLGAFSDETLVLLLARQINKNQEERLKKLKRYLSAYIKNRHIKTVLTGHDLQVMGIKPGPRYAAILGKLLDARIDGTIRTETEEQVFVQQQLNRYT